MVARMVDPDVVKEWKAGYLRVNEFTLEEKRRRTPRERLVHAQKFLDDLISLGKEPKSDNADFHLRWQKVRKVWLARQSKS
ncbi:MAG TPA: hypothetical protein PKA27_07520 [Fimbriimonadaceae bacterium]|nr:hypothetical protein [Fimbriimonadaceae bacterium]